MSFQARQGDVFFEVISADKVNKTHKKNDPILAHGEVTGHCHKIYDPPISELEMYTDEAGDIFVMNPKGPIYVSHDEHGTVTLPQGQWIRITRQREYDPAANNRERRVAD